jgi:hypothetical protein
MTDIGEGIYVHRVLDEFVVVPDTIDLESVE